MSPLWFWSTGCDTRMVRINLNYLNPPDNAATLYKNATKFDLVWCFTWRFLDQFCPRQAQHIKIHPPPQAISKKGMNFFCPVQYKTLKSWIFRRRASKTAAKAKTVRENFSLTPVGLNADKLPRDSLTVSVEFKYARLEHFTPDVITGQQWNLGSQQQAPRNKLLFSLWEGVKKKPSFPANRLRRFFCGGQPIRGSFSVVAADSYGTSS